MNVRLTLAAALAATCTGIANADVLWDQSALDWNAPTGYMNVLSGNPNTAYTLGDVNVGAGGWNVNSVTMYFTCFDFNWPATTMARLNIFTHNSPLPAAGDDPASGGLVPGLVSVTATILNDESVQQAYYAVTVSGLNINLAAGSYWIGLTPAVPGGFFGPEIGLAAATQVGDYSPYRSPFSGFMMPPANTWANASGTYDAALLVTGTLTPTPGAAAVMGLAGLFVGRRRR